MKKNSFLTTVYIWSKNRLAIILFLVAFVSFSFNPIKRYFTTFSYEDNVIKSKNDKSPEPFGYFLNIKYSTPNAFLPYEKIHVKVRFAAMDSAHRSLCTNETAFWIYFQESELVNKIKNEPIDYAKIEPQSVNKVELTDMFILKNTGKIELHASNDTPNLYTGEGDIFYKKEGEYPILTQWIHSNHIDEMSIKIKISSSVDLMNKKTNDLLFIIALLGLLIPIYFEFKKKQQRLANQVWRPLARKQYYCLEKSKSFPYRKHTTPNSSIVL